MTETATVISSNLSANKRHALNFVLAVEWIVIWNVDRQTKRVEVLRVQMFAGGSVAADRTLSIG